MGLNVIAPKLPVSVMIFCVQLFQAEQRLQRSQQQLKDLRQAAADANPESEYPRPAVASAGHSWMEGSRTQQSVRRSLS